ncbi:ead/Ea22-like family protein [Phytobacter diazotrophicus]|uniref:ead/Ea22-like family protein n=1 Tax=Phytobacter diazotrophicus TaxID=395631 RepID=UPI002FF7347F
MLTNEQIQALKEAIDDATQGSWVNEPGEGWEAICCDDDQGNAGFIIAEFQGRDAAANRKFVQAANPNTIRSLLAERDADKALIAEQAKRIAETEQKADIYDMLRTDYELDGSLVEFVDWQAKRIAELEARTVTVKLPERCECCYSEKEAALFDGVVEEYTEALESACAAAGITLVVGE